MTEMTRGARRSPFLSIGILLCGLLAATEVLLAQEPASRNEPHPTRGSEGAIVTIVEFAEFECEQCRDMHATLTQVLETYPDQVRIVFRQLPLNTVHPHSQKAAEASLCAFDQNGFWEYHDALFVNAKDLGVDSLKHWADVINLDRDRFDICLDSGEKAEAVREDIRAAIDDGAYSTPTLYINGRMMTGNWEYRDVSHVIEGELFRLLGEEFRPPQDQKGPDDADPGPLLLDRSLFQGQ
jgi:protein-disulfide isomerase